MSEQPVQPPAPPLLRPRAPWTLRLAGLCWAAAGVVFALVPLLAALMLRSQYLSLRRGAFRAADLADRFSPEELLRLEPYLAEFERFEAVVADASGWTVLPLVLMYAAFALTSLTCYLLLAVATARGVNGARIVATVIAGFGCLAVFALWQTFVAFAWLPVNALNANHAGLVIIALHIAGIVFAYLPRSNAYVRQRSAAARAAQAAQTAQAAPAAQTSALG